MLQQKGVYLIEQNAAVRRALAHRLDQEPSIAVIGQTSTPPSDILFDKFAPRLTIYGLPKRSDRPVAYICNAVRRLVRIAPLIVLDAYLDDTTSRCLAKLGAEHYLLKQPDTTQLIDTIYKYIDTNTSSYQL